MSTTKSWFARLERRFGRYAIEGLVTYVVGASGVAAVLGFAKPEFIFQIMLLPQAVRHGQLWRLVTFMLVPGSSFSAPVDLLLYLVFFVPFMIWLARSLEEQWGAFRLNAFFFVGAVATAIASMAMNRPTTNFYLWTTLLLAAATEFPEQEVGILVMVPLKWFGLFDLGYEIFTVRDGRMTSIVPLVVSLVTYLLFCGPQLRALLFGGPRHAAAVRYRAARSDDAPTPTKQGTQPNDAPVRACKLCGLTDADEGADLRVCTCKEVCGGNPTVYCLAHARSHRQPPAPAN